jgi:hypothetical protein
MDNPTPWLMRQEGLDAVRARRSLGLERDGNEQRVLDMCRDLAASQLPDGSFDRSLLKTAGVLNLLDDMRPPDCADMVGRAVDYLISVLEAQPGYEQARRVKPGTLQSPCDLCGFFVPYEKRNVPGAMAKGAAEMNVYREFEPLLGPKTPVRGTRRSSLDRAGPGSCYSWGLIPLAYTVEAICRAGYAATPGLAPAINVLLGAQRASGGWCRNPGGHPSCTVHALRAVGSHPRLRRSDHAERALRFMAGSWTRAGLFAALQAVVRFDSPTAHTILADMLRVAAARQRKNGSFGTPCPTERVAAVLMALRSMGAGRTSIPGRRA